MSKKKILECGETTEGVVTEVKTCWWIKINTKPIRSHALDGAVFPHVIRFEYSAAGERYNSKAFVSYLLRCPQKGERVIVCYDRQNPRKCAVKF